ncbi:hypothetical protein Droror1_Dr00027196 [Drosera rotundifolia]
MLMNLDFLCVSYFGNLCLSTSRLRRKDLILLLRGEAKDLKKLPLSDLIGSLIAHEMTLKQQEEDEAGVSTRTKGLALQATESSRTYEECGGFVDESITFLSRRYFNFLKKMDDKKKVSGYFSSKSTSEPCFYFGKTGHFKKDCSMLKHGDFKGKKMQFSAADKKMSMLVACKAWDAYTPLLMKILMMNQRMKKAPKGVSWLKNILKLQIQMMSLLMSKLLLMI